MKSQLLGKILCAACVVIAGCTSAPRALVGGNEMGVNVQSNLQHIDWMTMDISDDYITYDIDVLSNEGKIILQNASEESAKNIALSRAIAANRCDAIFQPRITTVRGDKNEILRVTVYGRPAKYRKQPDGSSVNTSTTIIRR